MRSVNVDGSARVFAAAAAAVAALAPLLAQVPSGVERRDFAQRAAFASSPLALVGLVTNANAPAVAANTSP